MLISSFAARLANQLQAQKIISSDMLEVYVYGLELIFSTAANVLLMSLVSLIAKRPLSWLLFLIAFVPQRITAGGYHAKTHFQCIFIGTVVFSASLLASKFIPENFWEPLFFWISLINFLVVVALSPVQSKNKPLSKETATKNRHHSLLYAGIVMVLGIVVKYAPQRFIPPFSSFFLGVFAAGVSLVAGKYNT